ncbi:MAG: NusG domain II-containing protein [Oscillospiraceae bacterium]|nr:NusG domain II-containing protein [Oscillospiraceae bacterium]
MIKTRTWIFITAVCAALLAVLSAALLSSRGEGTVVEILQDGTVIEEIDLSRVTSRYSFTVTWGGKEPGSNTILVQPGAICVSDADCPDRICVSQGWLTNQAAPVVCMPHRLIIRLKSPSGVDAVSQ